MSPTPPHRADGPEPRRRSRNRSSPSPGAAPAAGLVGAGTGRRLGRRHRARRPPTATRSSRCSPRRARPTSGWTDTRAVPLPRCRRGRAFAAPVGEVLGWLVAAGASEARSTTSARACGGWAGSRSGRSSSPRAARWSRCCASARRRRGAASSSKASYSVRWTPALVDPARLQRLADEMPGSVLALDPSVDARALTRSALTGMVDAICRDSARRHRGARAAAARPHRHRRRRGVPRPARRQRVRRAGRASRGELVAARRASGPARSPATHARARRAARPARRTATPGTSRSSRRAPSGAAGPDRAGDRRRRSEPARPRRRDDAPRAHAARAAAARRHAAAARWSLSQDEAWELMTVTGPRLAAAGFDVRVPALSRRKPTPSLRAVRRAAGDVGRRREPARQRRAGRRCSTTSSSPPPTSPGWPREARPLVRSRRPVGRARPGRPRRPRPPRSPSGPTPTQLTGAEILRHALGLEGSPLAGGVAVEGSGWAADLLAAGADASRPSRSPRPRASSASCAATRPRRWPGSASSTPPGSAAASPSTWASARRRRCSPTSLARAGDGPALVIAPPAVVGNWAAEAARFTPELRVVVHHGASRAVGRRARGRGRRRRRRHHHLRHRGARHRRARRASRGTASCSTRRRRSRTRPTTPRSSCAASRPARGSRSPARRSRTASATCGRSSTSPTPASSARGRRSSPSCRRRRREAERAARAQRHPRVPPHQDRARGRRRAARPDRRARPLHDDARADRAVPGGARRARRPAPTCPRASEPRKGQILAAITALKQICNHPAAYQRRRPAARRPLGQAGPARGDRRVGVRGRRADPGLHPLRRVGHAAGRPPHRASPACRSPATTAAWPAAPATASIAEFQSGDGPGRAGAVAEGRRHRAEPHRRQPRRALRPLVEPGRRGPGPRPRVAHRPDAAP